MQLETYYKNKKLEFEVSYRNRRTLAIQISPMEKIMVFSPAGLSEDCIIEKVRSKGEWIIKKLAEFANSDFLPQKRQFLTGESFLYLGKTHKLNVLLNRNITRPKVELLQNNIIIFSPLKEPEILREALQKWYKKEAKEIILKKVEFFRKICNSDPSLIKIKEQKRRWGSCSSKGNIYFNWRIVMAPERVIDYIVVHEISHLVHKNHSPVFYKQIESILPDYKKSRKWLKDFGIRMDI
ncbi:MAG: M48 family metallopeptidase [Candidatus Humimicrobiaceae bacterium]